PYDFHPVDEHLGYRINGVRGSDEKDVGKVKGNVDIIIPEFDVLLRIQDLEERGRGVALETLPELVDFVQHEHGIPVFAYFQSLDDLSRHRTHIGAAVPFYLGLVPHPAE